MVVLAWFGTRAFFMDVNEIHTVNLYHKIKTIGTYKIK